MTGAELLARVIAHYENLSFGDLQPGDQDVEDALQDGCVLLTREEAEKVRYWMPGGILVDGENCPCEACEAFALLEPKP